MLIDTAGCKVLQHIRRARVDGGVGVGIVHSGSFLAYNTPNRSIVVPFSTPERGSLVKRLPASSQNESYAPGIQELRLDYYVRRIVCDRICTVGNVVGRVVAQFCSGQCRSTTGVQYDTSVRHGDVRPAAVSSEHGRGTLNAVDQPPSIGRGGDGTSRPRRRHPGNEFPTAAKRVAVWIDRGSHLKSG